MKQHKKTDKIIKGKMENFSMDAPMHLFDGIIDALDDDVVVAPKPNSKTGNGKYWLLGLLLLTIAGGSIWYSTYNLSAEHAGNTSTNSTQGLTVNSTTQVDVISENSSDNFSIEKSNTATASNAVSEEEGRQANEANELSIANSAISNSASPISKSDESEIDFVEKNKQHLSLRNASKTATVTKQDNQNSTIQLTEKGSDAATRITDTEIENSFRKSIKEKNSNTFTKDVFETKNEISTASKIIAVNKEAKEDIVILPTLKTSKTALKNADEIYKLDLEPKCGIKPDGSKIKFTTSVDVFFSPDYASQILEYKSNDFKDYAELRTKSESASYSFNTGVRVNFLTEYDWAFRTGLIYTQINEIFKTQHEETVITIDVATGDTLGFQTGLRDVNIRNSYRMIDIPLLIGYESQMKKFKLNINAGAFINLSAEQKGALFSPLEDRVVYFTEGHPDDYDIFRKRIGWSAFVGLGFNFPLSKKLQLIIEPHARYYPKSFTLKNYILNQKYVSGGVMIGLRRDL